MAVALLLAAAVGALVGAGHYREFGDAGKAALVGLVPVVLMAFALAVFSVT